MLLTGHKSRAIFDRYNIINEQELLDAGDQLVAYLAQHAQATPRGERPHLARTAAPRTAQPLLEKAPSWRRSVRRDPCPHAGRSPRSCGHQPRTRPLVQMPDYFNMRTMSAAHFRESKTNGFRTRFEPSSLAATRWPVPS